MSTYGELVDTILEEIRRPQLRTQVQRAVQRAMKHYDKVALWFHEARAATYLEEGEAYYEMPSDFQFLTSSKPMEITVNGNQYPISMRTWDYLQEIDDGRVTGIPTDWGFFQDRLRVYPTPDDSDYVITLSYVKRADTVAAATDSNAWTDPDHGEELIRYRAKWDIFLNVTKDPVQAGLMKQAEQEAFDALTRASGKKSATGRITPSYL